MPYIGNKEILKMSFKINQGDNIFTENIDSDRVLLHKVE